MNTQPRAFRNVSDVDSGLASASEEAQAGNAQALTPGSGPVAVPDSENFGDPDQSDREYTSRPSSGRSVLLANIWGLRSP